MVLELSRIAEIPFFFFSFFNIFCRSSSLYPTFPGTNKLLITSKREDRCDDTLWFPKAIERYHGSLWEVHDPCMNIL
jgi:hypothetical protein